MVSGSLRSTNYLHSSLAAKFSQMFRFSDNTHSLQLQNGTESKPTNNKKNFHQTNNSSSTYSKIATLAQTLLILFCEHQHFFPPLGGAQRRVALGFNRHQRENPKLHRRHWISIFYCTNLATPHFYHLLLPFTPTGFLHSYTFGSSSILAWFFPDNNWTNNCTTTTQKRMHLNMISIQFWTISISIHSSFIE